MGKKVFETLPHLNGKNPGYSGMPIIPETAGGIK
jgi:hypothetical protein